MISLNGVTLDEDILWSNEFDNPAIAQSTTRTILGNPIIQHMPIVKGNLISLIAVNTGSSYSGSFTRAQIIEFKILEASGSIIELNYEGILYNVIIVAGGVQMTPLIARPNQAISDLYTGILNLIEV